MEKYKANTYSQFGEDGIIKEILFRLRNSGIELNNWACEFGAWDGLYLSNTARLILEEEFNAVLIEGDPKKVKELNVNFPGDRIKKICSFVTHNGEHSLERILTSTAIPRDFDFLSIDIDGMDYFILQSLELYRPKLICIEFNPTIPNLVHFVQPEDYSIKQGSSANAFFELATKMNYAVVAATHCNLFLLDNVYSKVLDLPLPSLDDLVPNGQDVTYVFSGYDGTLLSNKSFVSLGWHGSFPIVSIQILPKFLRTFSGDYSILQKILFRGFFFVKSKDSLVIRIRNIFTGENRF